MILLRSVPAEAADGAHFSQSLTQQISQIVCAQKSLTKPWEQLQAGVFFAQVSGEILKKSASQKEAMTLANKLGHHSYATGRCPKNGDAWTASAPAADIEFKFGDNAISFNSTLALTYCSQILVDLAPFSSAGNVVLLDLQRSKAPAVQTQNLDLTKSPQGVITLTCKSNDKASQLWYMVFHGPVVTSLPQVITRFASLAPTSGNLVDAINALRTSEKLESLQNNLSLEAATKPLADSKNIAHDLGQLKQQAKNAKKDAVLIIGEDRVIGSDLEEMLWLLWNSPQHRSLLLNPLATKIGVRVQKMSAKSNEPKLAVILLGK